MKLESKKRRLKAIPRLTTKLGVRQFAIISSALMAAIIFGWFGFLNFQNEAAHGATTGDYRTAASGNWNTTATWQRYNGTSWVAAGATPTNSDGVITIQNTHTVTITANVTADQVVVASGGQITLNSGVTFTVNNGTGADLDVTGVFNNAGTVTINASATIAYQSGGKYQHNFTTSAGTIPAATWNAASSCEILGYTTNSSAPTGLTQTFGNFTWNCPSQSSDIDLAGGLTTINGTFTVTSTGSKELRIASTATTLNIGGNYTQTAGLCAFSNSSSSNPTINISGNFGLSGGTCTLANGSSSLPVLNLFGNYSQSSGTFSVSNGSNSTATINAYGNWSHTGGTVTVGGNSSTNAQFIFIKSGSQTFTASGNTVSGNIDFSVKSGSTLVMGNNILTGRDFNLSSGGGIQIGSALGISNLPLIGNIQVSGTPSYSTGASYTYNGTAAQVTGDGLPGTIANLTINNSNGLRLNNTVSVSNTITFINGDITTGLNELISTNTAPAGVTGHSASSYVVGVIRRSVSGTGTYDFPIGTATNYEMASVTLSSATGFTNILASFTNVDPLDLLLPLTSVVVNAMPINRILDYGYWTLTPNSSMTGGNYTVTLKEKGYTASAAAPAYCVLKRPDALSAWQSTGTHNYALQTESGGVVTAVRSGLTSFSDFAIGYGEYLQWENPVLISGVAGQVGAVYNFAGVSTGVDAWVEIVSLVNGATLNDIDYSTGGYSEAWQPFIVARANATSSILWKISYKVIGTNTDTMMGNLSLSAIDVDGGNGMKEFVEASNIYSYSIDPSTSLSISYGTRGYRALGGNTSISNIDTSFHHAIFQINHRNVTSFFYETGVVNTTSAGTRQFSLYFKYFMPGNVALPIKLLSFNAKYSNKEVGLQWSTATETNNDYFTIERSADGEHFEKVLTKKGAGTSHSVLNYSAVDKYPVSGTSYYRLKQTDFNGEFSYSELVTVNNHNSDKAAADLEIKSVAPSVFNDNFKINYSSNEEGEVLFVLANYAGQVITQERINTQQGMNSYQYNDEHNIPPGVYFVVLLFNDKKVSYKVIKQ